MFNAHTFTVNLRRDNDSDEKGSNSTDMLGDESLTNSADSSFVKGDKVTEYSLTKEEFETIELQGNYKIIKCNERQSDARQENDSDTASYKIVFIDFTRRIR